MSRVLGADTSTAIHHHKQTSPRQLQPLPHGVCLAISFVDAAIARIGLETTCVYHKCIPREPRTIAIVAVTGQARVVSLRWHPWIWSGD